MTPAAHQIAPEDWTPAQRQAAIDYILLIEEASRRTSRTRMEAWTSYYLGEKFTASPGTFHRNLYADVEDLLWRREIDGAVRTAAAWACPRLHGKSTALVLGMALWSALEWASMPHFKGQPPYILIVSDTIDQARSRIMDLRDTLEDNERILEDYGDQGPTAPEPAPFDVIDGKTGRRRRGRRKPRRRRARRKWTETHLELANGTIIRAMGADSKVRGLLRKGRRPSLIICDDMENDKAVETKEQRRKLRQKFTRALIPTGKAGELLTVVVGTILHADSLLSRLLSPDHFQGWLKRRFAARYTADGLPSVDGEVILWPEYWTAELLDLRKGEIGSLAFAQEYLNLPVDDETAPFRLDWLTAAVNRGRGLPFLRSPPARVPYDLVLSTWDAAEIARAVGDVSAYQVLITAWDLSLVDDEKKAKEKDSDYTVGITVGLTIDDRVQVRRVYRARGLTPSKMREAVINEHALTAPNYVGIENNAAQRWQEIALRDLGLPIVGFTTDRKKHSVWEGVPGMALAFEIGRIDLCASDARELDKLQTMVTELHGLGREAHDDTVMALWIALTLVSRWMRQRDKRRRRLLGDPPPGYVSRLFPERHKRAS